MSLLWDDDGGTGGGGGGGPCPPLPTRYTIVTFDTVNPEVSYSGGLRADDDTVYGLGLVYDGNWYYCAQDVGEVIALTVNAPGTTKYNRIRFRKAGAVRVKLYGNLGTVQTVDFDENAAPEFVQLTDWLNLAGQCGEYITSVDFRYNNSGLWAIDDVEFGTVP